MIDPQMIDNMKDNDLKILAHMLLDIRNNERKEMEYAKKQSRYNLPLDETVTLTGEDYLIVLGRS